MDIIKTCRKHGDQNHFLRKGYNSYRCRVCTREAVAIRRKKLKKELVEYAGGCCKLCGYDECYSALEFHHTDPSKKEHGIIDGSKISSKSLDRLKSEADKCLLLCANCHREIHAGLRRKLIMSMKHFKSEKDFVVAVTHGRLKIGGLWFSEEDIEDGYLKVYSEFTGIINGNTISSKPKDTRIPVEELREQGFKV